MKFHCTQITSFDSEEQHLSYGINIRGVLFYVRREIHLWTSTCVLYETHCIDRGFPLFMGKLCIRKFGFCLKLELKQISIQQSQFWFFLRLGLRLGLGLGFWVRVRKTIRLRALISSPKFNPKHIFNNRKMPLKWLSIRKPQTLQQNQLFRNNSSIFWNNLRKTIPSYSAWAL